MLKVRPKSTEVPAERPAVLTRSFCEATSPTKAHPRLPTVVAISFHFQQDPSGKSLTRNVEEGPHASYEDEKTLQRVRLWHEAQNADDQHSDGTHNRGDKNDLATSEFIGQRDKGD